MEVFRNDVGHFWGILETRPYMRARQGLALCLWESGACDEAVSHYRELLRLNPNDNQGIRYLLIGCLLTLGREDDAAELLARYKGDISAEWAWSKALLLFRREADSTASRKALSRAMKCNPHVPEYLLGRKSVPGDLPDFVGVGDEREAVSYVHGGMQAWTAAPGALDWVAARLK
jgi:tetratricopeptide (TPR) repeat protein